jgi:hypothetical protein
VIQGITSLKKVRELRRREGISAFVTNVPFGSRADRPRGKVRIDTAYPSLWLMCRSQKLSRFETKFPSPCRLEGEKEPAISTHSFVNQHVLTFLCRCGNLGHFAETCTSDERYFTSREFLVWLSDWLLDFVTTANNPVMSRTHVRSPAPQVQATPNLNC